MAQQERSATWIDSTLKYRTTPSYLTCPGSTAIHPSLMEAVRHASQSPWSSSHARSGNGVELGELPMTYSPHSCRLCGLGSSTHMRINDSARVRTHYLRMPYVRLEIAWYIPGQMRLLCVAAMGFLPMSEDISGSPRSSDWVGSLHDAMRDETAQLSSSSPLVRKVSCRSRVVIG